MSKFNEPYATNLTEKDWLAHRKLFITATEAGSLMGVNPYGTPSKLLREKPQPSVKLVSPFLDRGLEHEEAVINQGCKWLDAELIESQGFYANADTRISATPDALLKDGRMIEAKCSGIKNATKWGDFPPAYYIMQCQVQMYVTGAVENYLMARFFYNWPNPECEPGMDRMWKIDYNEEIMNICIDKVKEFWYALDNNETIRLNKEESNYHAELLKSTCSEYRGQLIMQKFEIEPVQLSIIRQTCLKAAAKMVDTDILSVVELAERIEKEIFFSIAEACQDNSRNFLIQIGAAVNGYVESGRKGPFSNFKAFVLGSLQYVAK